MKIEAVCPRCSGLAPLLENKCPECHASLMTGCHRCRAAVHLAEGVCWNCRVEHPAAGHPSSLRDGEPVVDVETNAASPGGEAGGADAKQPKRGRKRQNGQATGDGANTALPAFLSSSKPGTGASRSAAKILVALALVAGAGGAILVTHGRNESRSGGEDEAAATTDPTWDPRVTDLVAFVEHEVGLEFREPVAMVFADPDFVAHRDDDLLVAALDESAVVWSSIGAATGVADVTTTRSVAAIVASRVAYDNSERVMYVSTAGTGTDVRTELVGQLTVALLAQHLGMNAPEAGELEAVTGWAARISAARSWIATRYVAELVGVTRDEHSAQMRDDEAAARRLLLQEQGFGTASYLLGTAEHGAWLALELRDRGDAELSISELFAVAAPSELELLTPGRTRARPSIESPSPTGGFDVVAQGRLGALHLLVLLGERLDYDPSLAAAAEWRNDRYLVSRTADQVCLDLTVAVDAATAGVVVLEAFERWMVGLPNATVVSKPSSIALHTCTTTTTDAPAAGAVPAGATISSTESAAATETTATVMEATGAAPNSPTSSPTTRTERWSAGLVQMARADTLGLVIAHRVEADAAACVVDSMRAQLGNDGLVDAVVAKTAPGSILETPTFDQAVAACAGYYPTLATVGSVADTTP